MASLQLGTNVEEEIQIRRAQMRKEREKKSGDTNFCDIQINPLDGTTHSVQADISDIMSGPGELRTEDGGSTRDRLPFSGRFDNDLDRKRLKANKSVIQEYQSSIDGIQFIEYKYIGESSVEDDATKKQGLKWQNQSTGEIMLWNGTYAIIKKFGYTHHRIAIQKGKIEAGRMRYNLNYTFIDILADDTGMPIISK